MVDWSPDEKAVYGRLAWRVAQLGRSALFDGHGLMLPARQPSEERCAQHSAHECKAVWRDGAKGIDPRL
jgi:hypothetical protein